MVPRVFFAAALATLFVAPPAPAQARPAPSSEAAALGALHDIDELEMTLGSIAERRGATASMRRFGTLLRRDHRLADHDVARASAEIGFAYAPPAPHDRVAEDRYLLEEVRSARGAELDRRVLAATLGVESGAARMLREFRPLVSQKDVRRLIDRTLPLLDQHVAIARHLEKKP